MGFEIAVAASTVVCVIVGAFTEQRKRIALAVFAALLLLGVGAWWAIHGVKDSLDVNALDALIGITFLVLFSSIFGMMAMAIRWAINNRQRRANV